MEWVGFEPTTFCLQSSCSTRPSSAPLVTLFFNFQFVAADPYLLVGVAGLEPTVSWSQTRRDTNFAKPRKRKSPGVIPRLLLFVFDSYELLHDRYNKTSLRARRFIAFAHNIHLGRMLYVSHLRNKYTKNLYMCNTTCKLFSIFFTYRTPDRTRTGSLRILSPLCLPISPREFMTHW